MLDAHHHDHEEHALFVPTAQPADPPAIDAVTQRHRLPEVQVFGFEWLNALGIQPAVGRWFNARDDSAGSPQTAVLTYGYWQRRFGGDASAIGRQIRVDGESREIIGVMPQNFRFLDQKPDLILPMAAECGSGVLSTPRRCNALVRFTRWGDTQPVCSPSSGMAASKFERRQVHGCQLTKRASSPETLRHAPETAGRGGLGQADGHSREFRENRFSAVLAISREFSEVGR